jgi:hypothetical protein
MLFYAGGKQQQYAWNGNKIVAINQDLLNEGYTAAGGCFSGSRQHQHQHGTAAAAVGTVICRQQHAQCVWRPVLVWLVRSAHAQVSMVRSSSSSSLVC